MRTLKSIISRRSNDSTPSWQIVFEWEDIIAKVLSLEIKKEKKIAKDYFYPIIRKLKLTGLFKRVIPQSGVSLYFDSISSAISHPRLNKNCIPVIIDFWLNDKELDNFFKCYKDVALLLVTNREVYEKLLKNNCPIPLAHWALSMPDQYKLDKDENYKKDVEFAIIGRPNPFFIRMLDQYTSRHPGFRYICNKGVSSNRDYYYNDGEFFAKDTGREFYIDLIRRTKISCYTTPGLDESKKETSEYNQVTPRVFEMLCNGCQIIGHYPSSADTNWYQLNSIIPNVDTYEEFESCLDKMRNESADIQAMKSFMSLHFTSVRANSLIDILGANNIKVL